jgi:hypothetical protein
MMEKHIILIFIALSLLLSNCSTQKSNSPDDKKSTASNHNVIIGAMNNGNITADNMTATSGTQINLTVTSASGYKLKSGTLTYTITGGSPQAITGNSFIMPDSQVTINAEFEAILYTITLGTVTSGNSISIDRTNAIIGTTINFINITPSSVYYFYEYYTLKYTASDGTSKTVTGNEKYFKMPDSNVIVDINFRLYQIGDTGPAGGIIFYDKGTVSNGWRFFEAAKTDLAASVNYSSSASCSVTTNTEIGTGKTNTNNLKTDSNVTIIKLFDTYSSGGYTDWFLPSFDELTALMNVRNSIPKLNLEMSQNDGSPPFKFRASSSIYLNQYAKSYENDIYNGYRDTFYDLNWPFFIVRAIRQF